MYSYSINGSLLCAVSTTSEEVVFPAIAYDSKFNDFIIYVDATNNSIVTRKLPSLEKKVKKQFDKPITTFAITKNSIYGIAGFSK